jgi:DNA-binding NarL/FixJ family response regulator
MRGLTGLAVGHERPRTATGTAGTTEGIRVQNAQTLEGDARVRVLVVDDHPAFRRALTSALRLVGDIEIAGEAGGGVAACDQAEALKPDVVLMLTAHADAGVEREARDAGARGFLAKGTGLQDLVITLQEATGDEPEP